MPKTVVSKGTSKFLVDHREPTRDLLGLAIGVDDRLLDHPREPLEKFLVSTQPRPSYTQLGVVRRNPFGGPQVFGIDLIFVVERAEFDGTKTLHIPHVEKLVAHQA